MFLARNEAVATMFYNFAVQTATSGKVLLDVYQDVLASGVDGEEVGKRFIRCDLMTVLEFTRRSITEAAYPDTVIRKQMIENSLEGEIGCDEFTEMESYFSASSIDTNGGDFITHMPSAFVDKIPIELPPVEDVAVPWVPLHEDPLYKNFLRDMGVGNEVDHEASESLEESESSGSEED
jgi:hypothetical protein